MKKLLEIGWLRLCRSLCKFPKKRFDGNYGFVEFSFIKSETERIIVRVPISTYITEAEKSGTELFRFFYTPQ